MIDDKVTWIEHPNIFICVDGEKINICIQVHIESAKLGSTLTLEGPKKVPSTCCQIILINNMMYFWSKGRIDWDYIGEEQVDD